ncbi:MAG TPA: DUF5301 domain-containing protein [Mogibacterium sp.]|nr:DUF5301 domain-containing protein [Mogibacterium sp.]
MEKNLIISVITASILLILTACGGSDNELVLPLPEDIEEIEITNIQTDETAVLKSKEEISALINTLADNSKNTGKESVNDEPTNVEGYFWIAFLNKEGEPDPNVVFVYIKDDAYYLEQPYIGIWETDIETYDKIKGRFTKEE